MICSEQIQIIWVLLQKRGDLTHKHLKKPTTHEMFHFEMIRTEALSLPGSLSAPRHGALRGNGENLQGSRDSWLSGFRSFYPKA